MTLIREETHSRTVLTRIYWTLLKDDRTPDDNGTFQISKHDTYYNIYKTYKIVLTALDIS